MRGEPSPERGAAFAAVIRTIDAAHDARDMLSASTRPAKARLRELVGDLIGPLWVGLGGDRAAWTGPTAPTKETVRSAADALDELAGELQRTTEHVADPVLDELVVEAPSWGSALWDGEVPAQDLQPRVTEAIETLNRHKVRLILGRDPSTPAQGDS